MIVTLRFLLADETDLEEVLSLSAAGEIPTSIDVGSHLLPGPLQLPSPSVKWFDKPLYKKEKSFLF